MVNNTSIGSFGALDGSKTSQNLERAFEREAKNYARNSIFAQQANREDSFSARRTFLEQAENDMRHAELWLGYLDELGDTLENLDFMFSQKSSPDRDFYEQTAIDADDEGFTEIAEKMRLMAAVKNNQAVILDEEARKLEQGVEFEQDPETEWHCQSCGYSVRGNLPPERCPLCAYPEGYFIKKMH